MKFALCCIPSFDVKIYGMNTNVDDTQSNPGWHFSTSVPFKKLTTEHQHQLPLIHIQKQMLWNPFNKVTVHQFHVGFISYPGYIYFKTVIQTSHSKEYQKRVNKKLCISYFIDDIL